MSGLSITLVLIALAEVAAFEARLLDPAGRPMRGADVSIAGRAGSVRTDGEGRFAILPAPDFPLTLIVVGSRGELYPPLYVPSNSAPIELRLERAFKDSITVMTGAAPNIEATPASATSVIGREELEERKPEHLVDVLTSTPGISARGEGAPAVPVMRGLSSGRTLLIVDDARVVSERRAGPSATFVNPFMLAAVEIARGPGSVAYGSDAMGGVVHARPRDPVPGQNEIRYDFWASGEGEKVISGAVEASHDAPGGALLAAIYGRSADDARAGDGTRIRSSSYADRGVTLRYVAHVERSHLRVGIASDRARDVGAPAADAEAVRTFYPRDVSDRLTFALDVEPGAKWRALEIRGSMVSNEVTTTRETLPGGAVTRQINSVTVEARDVSLRAAATRYDTSSRLMAGIDFVTRFGLRAAGIRIDHDRSGAATNTLREISIGDAHKRDFGFFVLYDHRLLHAVNISAGARADHISTENRGGHVGDRSRADLAWSGQLGVTVGPWRNITTSLQASTGYREPTLSDRYFRGVSGRGFITGNPDLEPERSVQYDLAMRWQRGSSSVALAAYHYEIRHLVERYRTGTDFFFRNRGRAAIRGVEIEAESRPLQSIVVRAGVAVSRGEERDDGTALDDVAAPNAVLEGRHAGRRHSLFATVAFFARDDRPGPLEVERPGHVTLDLGAGWHIAELLEIRCLVRNVTDRFYAGSADANASLAPGRSIMLGLNGRL